MHPGADMQVFLAIEHAVVTSLMHAGERDTDSSGIDGWLKVSRLQCLSVCLERVSVRVRAWQCVCLSTYFDTAFYTLNIIYLYIYIYIINK